MKNSRIKLDNNGILVQYPDMDNNCTVIKLKGIDFCDSLWTWFYPTKGEGTKQLWHWFICFYSIMMSRCVYMMIGTYWCTCCVFLFLSLVSKSSLSTLSLVDSNTWLFLELFPYLLTFCTVMLLGLSSSGFLQEQYFILTPLLTTMSHPNFSLINIKIIIK